jgi:hypothetical protein
MHYRTPYECRLDRERLIPCFVHYDKPTNGEIGQSPVEFVEMKRKAAYNQQLAPVCLRPAA